MTNNQPLPLPSQETLRNAIIEGVIVAIFIGLATTLTALILPATGVKKE